MRPMVMLVTGCRSGIGLETVLQAAKEGYVVYAGLRDIETKDALVSQSQGLNIIPVQMDITRSEERASVLKQILDEQGHLDVLINNAGVGIGGFLEELSEEEFRFVFEVNFFALWALSKECIPLLRESKGALVMISSLSGRMALPALGSYCASKFALEGMTEAWRHELKPFGIDVICIQPGAYKTDISGPNRRISPNEGSAHPFYTIMGQRMQDWYDKNAVAKAYPPAHLAENLMGILRTRNPRLRYAIGPSTGIRRLFMMLIPFRWMERYFNKVLTRGEDV